MKPSLLRSLVFRAGMVGATLVFGPLALLLAPAPFAVRYGFTRRWALFNLWVLARVCRLRFDVQGRDNIPPGPAIVFCKHQSAWETLALQAIFPPQVWVLKRELLWLPLFGWALALLKPIAIDRKSGRRAVAQIVEQGGARLRDGLWVVIFPEGTRVAPGVSGRYRPGGALLAEHSGYPVVPVAHNAGEFWPRRGLQVRPGTIRVVVGPCIETAGRRADDILAEARDWIESTMVTISGVPYAPQARPAPRRPARASS